MQNMRLLDLQTGQYLPLGKNWLYGEDWIVLTSFIPLYNRVQDAWFIEANEGSNITNARYLISELPQPLKTLCERVGAVVYGERYVLLHFSHNKTVGDIVKHNPKRTQFDQLPKMYHTNKEVNEVLCKHDVLCEEMGYSSQYVDPDYHCKITGNIFEEYSKQLRNEPNQFEELMKLIK